MRVPGYRVWIMVLLLGWPWTTGVAGEEWFGQGAGGDLTLDLYFFWSEGCPHCQQAHPDMKVLAAEYPWLRLHDLEVSRHPAHAARYRELAARLGQEAVAVPAFLFCGVMVAGYDEAGRTGQAIRRWLGECRASLAAGTGYGITMDDVQQQLLLAQAGLGEMALRQWSLPLVTVVVAGLDAFNPCAFFVLLFLLSLLVHAGGRGRMLLIGGVFVAISGLVYFGLMAAWLNVFLLTGRLPLVAVLAGLVAAVMAVLNLKDFLLPGQGPSLSMAQGAKPGLYQRVRGLLHADSLPTLLAGTVLLAVVANSYELLCTAGFPMLYTRLLTLEQLPLATYYLYLALYNLIYVLPLFTIVLIFTLTLGSRKLQAREGRLLKLLSGTMMLGLALVLLLAPERLSDLRVAGGLLGVALVTTGLAWVWLRRRA